MNTYYYFAQTEIDNGHGDNPRSHVTGRVKAKTLKDAVELVALNHVWLDDTEKVEELMADPDCYDQAEPATLIEAPGDDLSMDHLVVVGTDKATVALVAVEELTSLPDPWKWME